MAYTLSVRIASLSPAATEALFAAGRGGDIVVTDQFSNFPEEARRLPKLLDHARVDPAKLRAFSPEVVLTATVVQERLAEQLQAQGVSVFHQDPRHLSEVITSWRTLGTLVNAEEGMAVVIADFEGRLKRLKDRAKLLPRPVRVYLEEWHEPPMASGNWVPELAAAAGVNAFPIPAGELSRAVTLEEVRAFDPELIVISWCGAGSLADKALLATRPEWESLSAVRAGRILVIDDSLFNRPGPRLVEGAERLYSAAFELLHGA